MDYYNCTPEDSPLFYEDAVRILDKEGVSHGFPLTHCLKSWCFSQEDVGAPEDCTDWSVRFSDHDTVLVRTPDHVVVSEIVDEAVIADVRHAFVLYVYPMMSGLEEGKVYYRGDR